MYTNKDWSIPHGLKERSLSAIKESNFIVESMTTTVNQDITIKKEIGTVLSDHRICNSVDTSKLPP